MRALSLSLPLSVALLAASVTAIAQTTNLVDADFDPTSGFTLTNSGRGEVRVTTSATSGLTVGSGNQLNFYKGGTGGAGTATATLVFTVPDALTLTNLTSANLSFDYIAGSFAGTGASGSMTITGGTNGTVNVLSLTGNAAANSVSQDLTTLFQDNPGAELTLRFAGTQGTGPATGNRLFLGFDNILLSYTITLPPPPVADPAGGGSGSSAAAVATMNANRRAQQQMQAHQARVARQQVAQQHRRNQQR